MSDVHDDVRILELSVSVLSEALNALVGACMEPDGKPRAPSVRELMQARAYLPAKCTHAFTTKGAKK